ncbi:MAG: pseudouridine synthase [Rothia sp. (in: high G+C Gram-positive bacteria)]|nr:pseudouridine synthase [Rothia sp. (in: high G+C Gram-positive bacteria)]
MATQAKKGHTAKTARKNQAKKAPQRKSSTPKKSSSLGSSRPFAHEIGERRPQKKNYAGPHRPRRPRAEPVDHFDFYEHEGIRLQKVMAQAGVASRRVCEEMISQGRVTVNEQIVTELGLRVDPEKVIIRVDGITIQTKEKMIYLAFNKPAGVVSTMEDPEGRPCIKDYLRSSMSQRVFHVGRLDVETEGLLLLTNDGELTNRLTHPSYRVPKTYLVQVRGPVENGLGNQLKKGIRLEDGLAQLDSFRLVDSTPGHVLIEVSIHSGKNRIVRRLFEAVGYPLEKLVRVEMGPIRIGSQRQGSVRNLSQVEIGELLASVGM